MLDVRIQRVGDATVLRCAGRIVVPYAAELRSTVLCHLPNRTLVLDLANVLAVDAGGLGMLVSLHAWGKASGTALKLMNLTPPIEELLELTNLKSTFEVCSAREMMVLLCSAINETESVEVKTLIQVTNFIDETLGDSSLAMAARRSTPVDYRTYRDGTRVASCESV
jgi:anti-anti-sigma factor